MSDVAPTSGAASGRTPATERVVDDLARWLRVAASVTYTASTVDEALRGALDLVCEHTAWPLGHAFLCEGPAGVLVSTGIWHDDQPQLHGAFVEATAAMSLGHGVGLPGRIVASGKPAWIGDVRRDRNFPRRKAAIRSGLVSGFGVPIVSSRGLEGVLEFFTDSAVAPDPPLLELLSHVGIHLGTVVDRVRAQSALRQSEGRLRSLVESAPDALFLVGPDGTIVLVNGEAERLTGYDRDDLVGRNVDQLVPEDLRRRHAADRDNYGAEPARRGMGVGRELVLRRRDGSTVPVEIGLAPLESSAPAVVVASVRDLSERRRIEEAVRTSDARLAEAEQLARVGSWAWDVESDTVTWSAELLRLYDVGPDDGPLTFPAYIERVHPADRERVQAAVGRCLETLEPFEHEYRIVRPGGEERWVHARGAVLAHLDGRPRRLGGYCRDVTEQRHAEDRRNRALLDLDRRDAVLERIARGDDVDGTLDQVCRDVERRCPGAMASVLLVDPAHRVLRHAAAPSLPEAFRREIDGLPVSPTAGACGAAAATGATVVVGDVTTDPLTSTFRQLAERFGLASVWSQPLTSAAGEVLGTLAIYRDAPHAPDEDEVRVVTAAGNLAALAVERHLAQRALARAADVDPLTGLANRAAFLRRLGERLRDPTANVAVMFLDLDRFKWINDSLGHPAGDRVLVELAGRFEHALAGGHLLARFGGDEFTVLVDGATDPAVARAAEALRASFTEPFVLDGGEFFLTVSVGIARGGPDTDPSALVRDADAAMYAAKDSGRDRHVVFDDSLRERAVARVTLESEIRRGIERDELVEYFQPIVELASGRCTGAEALVRWHHPVRGLTGPDQFIPLAEETGLIVPLGGRVLEHTIAQAAAWADAGLALPVSVNVSVIQLADPMIAPFIDLLLDHHGLPADRLVVEVTESAVMERLDTARGALERIAGLGAAVVIDDFGTGYSSIARLGDLPVVGIKIDRSFTAKLGGGTAGGAEDVVAAITDLAHALGLYVVAEGLETAEAVERVRALGCDLGQGYFLGPPVVASEMPAVVAARRSGGRPDR